MYIDKNDFHWFMGVKLLLMVICFKFFSVGVALTLTIVFAVSYRDIVAKVLGLRALEIGD